MTAERNYIAEAIQTSDVETARQVSEAEFVKQLLTYCSFRPGADITIQVKHSDGHCAVAHLYDHAALVQSLYEALEYFQSEML